MKQVDFIGVLFCASLISAGCSEEASSTAKAGIPVGSASSENSKVSQLTTREFRALVGGKTKQEIRATLGTPKNVSTAPHRREVWHYDARDLNLYDEDAGVEVRGDVTVLFDDSELAREGNYNFKSEYIFS